MLQISDLVYRIEGRPLFEGASVTINAGEHVGLVGRNGTGKSTLLRLIDGELQPDGGQVRVSGGLRIGRLKQEAPAGPDTLLDTVLSADHERTALLHEAETATDPNRIAQIHTRLTDIDAHAAPGRAARILAGLGFSEAAQQRACAEFSGGWRMRVALAALLFSAPDVLLLDEPTNHLDLEASLWLEGYLKSWPGTVLLVSHDRELLNSIPHKICHLRDGRLTLYQGGYDRFERTRREQLERQRHIAEERDKERARIQAFVDRFRAKASKARQAQSRLKLLARMEPITPAVADKPVRFDFPQPTQLPPPLIAMDNVTVGYQPGQPILKGLNRRIDQDDRIALLGANGNGKTTLARLIAGRLTPQRGTVTTPSELKVGYFAQDQADELDYDGTPFSHMAEVMPNKQPTQLRTHLGRFGFSGEKAETPARNLSGGEKARLLFALMTRNAPHMLVLDEPTNHLDIEARDALIQALNAFEGAVILVSHDPHLVELVADRLWLVSDGSVETWDDDLAAYKKYLLERGRGARRDDGTGGADSAGSKKDKRKAAAANRAATADLRKKVRQAEQEMEKLSAEKDKVEALLADPKVYEETPDKVPRLQKALAQLNDKLAAAEETWLAAEEELEAQG